MMEALQRTAQNQSEMILNKVDQLYSVMNKVPQGFLLYTSQGLANNSYIDNPNIYTVCSSCSCQGLANPQPNPLATSSYQHFHRNTITMCEPNTCIYGEAQDQRHYSLLSLLFIYFSHFLIGLLNYNLLLNPLFLSSLL